MDQQKTSKVNEPMQSDFAALPLEDKIRNLMKMEVVTLGETFSYVVKSSMEVFEKVGESIGSFGSKVETEARKAAQSASSTPEAEKAKPKAKQAKKTNDKPSKS